MWKFRAETHDGEVQVFTALETYELTEEQKLLWKTAIGGEKQITAMRIKTLSEEKIKDGSEQAISRPT